MMLYPRISASLAATLQLFHPVTTECVEAALYALSAPLRAMSGFLQSRDRVRVR